ncbi:MAG: beta-eliminating lyase-related protein [Desulfobacterales bacterium]|nr:beta-eliminating lyase-related protein [Desulfobacterales bacterium]
MAMGVPAKDVAAQADSVTFCLSQGLGAPVGSVVTGTRDFIDKARRARKMLGERHAPGRRDRRRRHRGAGDDGGAAARGSRECPHAGRGAGPVSGSRDRPRSRSNEHRGLRPGAEGPRRRGPGAEARGAWRQVLQPSARIGSGW